MSRRISPNAYCYNNPMRFIDPDGMYSTEEWMKDHDMTDKDIKESYTVSDTENAESSSNNQENGGPKKRNTSDKTQNTKSGGSWFTQDDIPVWCWARKASNDWENGDYAYTVGDVLMGVVDLALIWVPGDITGRSAAKEGIYLVYVGLDVAVRFGEHLNSGTARSFLDYRVIDGATGLSKTQARIWEQTLINQYGLQKNGGMLLNKVNSIAPKYWLHCGIKP